MSRRVYRSYDKGFVQTYIEYLLDSEKEKLSGNDRRFLQNYKNWEEEHIEIIKELDKYIDNIVVLVREYKSSDGKITHPVGLRLHVILQTFGSLLGLPIYVYRKKLITYASSKKTPLLLRPDYFVVDRTDYAWK